MHQITGDAELISWVDQVAFARGILCVSVRVASRREACRRHR